MCEVRSSGRRAGKRPISTGYEGNRTVNRSVFGHCSSLVIIFRCLGVQLLQLLQEVRPATPQDTLAKGNNRQRRSRGLARTVKQGRNVESLGVSCGLQLGPYYYVELCKEIMKST